MPRAREVGLPIDVEQRGVAEVHGVEPICMGREKGPRALVATDVRESGPDRASEKDRVAGHGLPGGPAIDRPGRRESRFEEGARHTVDARRRDERLVAEQDRGGARCGVGRGEPRS